MGRKNKNKHGLERKYIRKTYRQEIKEGEKIRRQIKKLSKKQHELQLKLEKNPSEQAKKKKTTIDERIVIKETDLEEMVYNEISTTSFIEAICKSSGKKIILFCEGNYSSLDYKLYNILYEDAIVIPVGSWASVQVSTEKYRQLSDCVYGIMDKDSRGNILRVSLEKNNILFLKVRAIENLLATDEVVVRIIKSMKIRKPKKLLNSIKKTALSRMQDDKDEIVNKKDVLTKYYPHEVIRLLTIYLRLKNDKEYYEKFFALLKRKGRNKVIEELKQYIPIIEYPKQSNDETDSKLWLKI